MASPAVDLISAAEMTCVAAEAVSSSAALTSADGIRAEVAMGTLWCLLRALGLSGETLWVVGGACAALAGFASGAAACVGWAAIGDAACTGAACDGESSAA